MKLADLFITYKLVRNPIREILPEDKKVDSKYLRLLLYIDSVSELPKIEEDTTEKTLLNHFSGWSYNTPAISSTKSTVSKPITFSGASYELFNLGFEDYLKEHPEDRDTKDILTSIAKMESGFTPDIKNPYSSAIGYFQFIDGTRKHYSNVSKEEFVSNPQHLYSAAVKLYRDVWNTLKPYKDRIKELGLTPLQVTYGMWWNPLSMINYLKTGSDNYINKSDNVTLQKILNRAK